MSYFQWLWARHRAMTRVRPFVWTTLHYYVPTTALVTTVPLQKNPVGLVAQPKQQHLGLLILKTRGKDKR